MKMKTCSQIFLPHRALYIPQLLKKRLLSETNVSQVQPAFIFEFSSNNNNIIMCKIYFKVNNRSSRQCFSVFNVNFEYIWHFVLVFILFCFYCWLWTCECQMEYFIAFIYLCVSEADLRSPVTFKTKLSITTISNSYQLLAFLSQGAPSLMLFKVWSANVLERICEQSHDQVYCWENMEKSLFQMPQNYISRVFHIELSFLHLISTHWCRLLHCKAKQSFIWFHQTQLNSKFSL